MTGDDLDVEVAKYLNGQPRRTLIAWIAAIVGVLAAVGLGYAVYAVNTSNDSNDKHTAEQLAEVRKDNHALEKNYTKLYAQFQACKDEKPNTVGCKKPAVPPADSVTPSPAPAVIIEKLSDAEIDTAVRRFCRSTGQCEGKDASKAMVSAAVSAYCNANGDCRGPAGADGADAPGSTTPPTDEQVQASVTAYCAQNGCKGDPGPLCPDGYHGEVVTVVTQMAPPEQDEIFACRRDS